MKGKIYIRYYILILSLLYYFLYTHRLKNEISNTENEIRFIYKRKKNLLIKKKYDLLQKEETEKYQEFYNQYVCIV